MSSGPAGGGAWLSVRSNLGPSEFLVAGVVNGVLADTMDADEKALKMPMFFVVSSR